MSKVGYPYYFGLDGSTFPAQPDGYLELATANENKATAQGRYRSNPSASATHALATVTNVHAVATALAPATGSIVHTAFSELMALGYNFVIDNGGVHVFNVVALASVALEVQISRNNAVIDGLKWAAPGAFNALISGDQGFIPGSPAYSMRWVEDGATAGNAGINAGDQITLRVQKINDRSQCFEVTFPAVLSAQVTPLSLNRTENTTGGGAGGAPVTSGSIADGYDAGTDATPETGTDMDGTAYVNQAAQKQS